VGTLITFGALLPVGIFLVLRLYEKLHDGFTRLVADRVIRFPDEKRGEEYLGELDHSINRPWFFWASLLGSLAGNAVWLWLLPEGDWKRLDSGPAAWWFRVFVVVNIYAILIVLLKGVVAVRRMRAIFQMNVVLQPLHPDGCGGLRYLGDMSIALNYFLGLIALFIWLKAFQTDLTTNVWFIVMMTAFAPLALYLFAAPLAGAHDLMAREKAGILRELNLDFQRTYDEVRAGLQGTGIPLDSAQKLQALDHLHRVASRMPVWPYDIRIAMQLVGTIVVPPVTAYAVEFANAYLLVIR